jgi:hypothetical protein
MLAILTGPGFPQSVQGYVEIVRRPGKARFLLNPFQFISLPANDYFMA